MRGKLSWVLRKDGCIRGETVPVCESIRASRLILRGLVNSASSHQLLLRVSVNFSGLDAEGSSF